jgi:uroporphyrinogen decarboxylase
MDRMTSRERVLTASRRGKPDRVPRDLQFERRVSTMMQEFYGTEDLIAATRSDVIDVGPKQTRFPQDYARYFSRGDVTWDEWGRGRVWDAEDHYAEYLYPLENAETVDEILNYPWPDLEEPYRYESLGEDVANIQKKGYAVRGSADVSETVFEIAWQLRSMDRLFQDMFHDEEMAAALLDQIILRNTAQAQAYARAGVDILYVGDDVAMQTGLMISRKLWRKWLGPRLGGVIQAAREIKPDILVQYHSDGKINDLIPDLIQAGVDILNPVQPECVDHHWVKEQFGDKLAFNAGLGVQSVLPFGTAEEVKKHVHEVIDILGAGGGLIIGPSHVIERDTPLENILAMIEAIDEYGVYA